MTSPLDRSPMNKVWDAAVADCEEKMEAERKEWMLELDTTKKYLLISNILIIAFSIIIGYLTSQL